MEPSRPAVPNVPAQAQVPAQPQRQTVRVPIHNTSALLRPKASVLYQGPPGSGKTFNMASWPGPLFLYCDTNLMGLAKFPGIPYVVIESWDDMERIWLPAIKNRRLTEYVQGMQEADGSRPFRDYKVESVALDSLTFLVNRNVLELGDGGAKSLGYDGWDAYYGRLHRVLTIATQATRPVPSRPSDETYHVLASVHEDTMTDEDGNITAIKPSVQGKMRGHLAAFFDAVLLTENYVVTVPAAAGQPPKREQHYRVWSFAPNKLREAKDQISGGRFGRLPPSCVGTYPELNKFWQMDGPVAPTEP